MTELELQLMNAFERLSSQQEKQYNELGSICKDLVSVFEVISKENEALRQQVKSLSEQVNGLSIQLQPLAKLYANLKGR